MFVMFYTGNGYRCGCCRRTNKDSIDSDLEGVIEYCIKEARYNEWDFGIDQIRELGEDEDEDEIIRKIKDAVHQAHLAEQNAEEIATTERAIKEALLWLNTVEQQREAKRKQLDSLTAKLSTLKGT